LGLIVEFFFDREVPDFLRLFIFPTRLFFAIYKFLYDGVAARH